MNVIKVADKLLKKIEKIADSDSIDAKGIKNLTSALKDLREIKGIKSDADTREQEARIKKLERELDSESDANGVDIHVTFGVEGEQAKWAE